MSRTWNRSRFAPWLLRELAQVNEKPTSRLCRRTLAVSARVPAVRSTAWLGVTPSTVARADLYWSRLRSASMSSAEVDTQPNTIWIVRSAASWLLLVDWLPMGSPEQSSSRTHV
jgi:hypothetical protein